MILIAFLPLVAKLFRNGSGSGGMLRQLAVFSVRRPKVVLGAVLVLLGVSIVFGGTVSDKLGVGGYTDPTSESSQADDFLDQHFGTTSNLVIQLLPHEGDVDSPEVAKVRDRVRELVKAEPNAQVTRSLRVPAS